MSENLPEKPDYRDTVFLPKTDFPMKAGLAAKEPQILARWAEQDLYGKLRESRAGRTRFLLHDGPPYANGDIHMGHAMNKILKDIVVRSQSLLGKDAPYVPGWDCHGLPIEWKVEEEYRKKKLDKDEVPRAQFRAECRAYAEKWVAVQSEQFQRLGVMGEWDDPYLTMKYEAEAKIVEELLKFAESGQLYRGAKPVMWSPVEKTALAEAEVEYEDITSTQIDVAFEIVESPIPELVGAYVAIWTTTPWTIPVNQAIAYGEEIEYRLVALDDRRYLVASDLEEAFLNRVGRRASGSSAGSFAGKTLAGTIARHPMHHLGGFFARPRPFLAGDFVTTDAGTGVVHMAPDHGEDDFLLCKAHGIDTVFAVEGDGKYRADWLWLGGQGSVINPKFNAPDGPICADLADTGALLAASADFQHSYPHSWRSKAKVIFRATPQWFIPMDKPVELLGGTLRATAMKAIDETRWVPARSKNRIGAMVEGRPDWVISRQRAWGVPIALYVHRKSGDYLRDPAVNARIIHAFHEGGADAWFAADHQALLGNGYDVEDYEPITDILDVWFDSGSTHSYVVEARYGQDVRADVYCEGSDQHRGWFQSSLLESSGTRGQAPYTGVLTHGFALDQNGRKMSKSTGNVVDPLAIIRDAGADILRLWVASTDYFEDVRIGKEVLATTTDAYRKLRNSFRYLLGALAGFTEEERVAPADMPELERWVLHRLAEIDAELRTATDGYEFNRYSRLLGAFANDDLSAFFFDIRKDSLYCDAPDSLKRRAYRTVLDDVFQALVRWASPILCFTAEEVWQTRYPDAGSIHLETWPEIDPAWRDDALAGKWAAIRHWRESVTECIEPLRRDKKIGSSLQARIRFPQLHMQMTAASPEDLAETFIVSEVSVDDALDNITVEISDHEKCGRCWRYLPEVTEDGALCARCDEVVNG
ncbi:isoleucine--tRNA ligase [Sphingosinicella rhizophila]|uniref:Isoleucine--tRNA ligase n=1 Tax=Sphingosinicella rhizophila TaxID=3050082 RepID=A0ABU3Q6L6_9SPHN|nr:isoleucine--tRNA ligase [Sphingosinicella sp. GR2756]MDT9599061.1 isoleucine--tRNA ligase [Sphingosinicella sp. GR2756]